MKKLLAAILVCALTISCFSMFGIFAEEAAEDPTTFRAYAYEDGAGYSASCWLNSFDPDGECIGTDYVVFKAAAPIKGFGFPEIFAGKEENDLPDNRFSGLRQVCNCRRNDLFGFRR